MKILDNAETEITMDDFRVLFPYIRERYPKKIKEIIKCTAIQKLKKFIKDDDILSDQVLIYDNDSDKALKSFIFDLPEGPFLNRSFKKNNISLFKALIDKGFDSTKKYDGFEPVDFEIVKCPEHDKANRFFDLLNAYSLETIDSDGNTLLMAAIQNRFSVDGVEQILKELPRMSIQNNKKQNVFHIAASHENGDYLRYLVNMPIEHTHYYNQQDSEGNTPVHVAARESLGNINYFLVEGADLTIKNNEGDTALHVIIKRQENMATEMIRDIRTSVQKFCEDGFLVGDADGNTPLHLAVKRRMLNCIEYLSSASSKSLYVKNKEGLTPVELCAQMDDPEVFSFLKRDDNLIPSILLTKMCSVRIIESNQNKIQFDERDEEGNTAFHLSLINPKCKDIARIFFRHIETKKEYSVLIAKNNSGQVPIVLVNKDIHSNIYNSIFKLPNQTEEEKFECRLLNNDVEEIENILKESKEADKFKFMKVLAKYGSVRQWNMWAKDAKGSISFLQASLKSNNIEMAKYFITKQKNSFIPIKTILEAKEINTKCLKYVIKNSEFKNNKDDFIQKLSNCCCMKTSIH